MPLFYSFTVVLVPLDFSIRQVMRENNSHKTTSKLSVQWKMSVLSNHSAFQLSHTHTYSHIHSQPGSEPEFLESVCVLRTENI